MSPETFFFLYTCVYKKYTPTRHNIIIIITIDHESAKQRNLVKIRKFGHINHTRECPDLMLLFIFIQYCYINIYFFFFYSDVSL